MNKVTYKFNIEMSKEDAKHFEYGEHSLSIYSNGPGKIAYYFREIKPSDEIDREVLDRMRDKRSNDTISDGFFSMNFIVNGDVI